MLPVQPARRAAASPARAAAQARNAGARGVGARTRVSATHPRRTVHVARRDRPNGCLYCERAFYGACTAQRARSAPRGSGRSRARACGGGGGRQRSRAESTQLALTTACCRRARAPGLAPCGAQRAQRPAMRADGPASCAAPEAPVPHAAPQRNGCPNETSPHVHAQAHGRTSQPALTALRARAWSRCAGWRWLLAPPPTRRRRATAAREGGPRDTRAAAPPAAPAPAAAPRSRRGKTQARRPRQRQRQPRATAAKKQRRARNGVSLCLSSVALRAIEGDARRCGRDAPARRAAAPRAMPAALRRRRATKPPQRRRPAQHPPPSPRRPRPRAAPPRRTARAPTARRHPLRAATHACHVSTGPPARATQRNAKTQTSAEPPQRMGSRGARALRRGCRMRQPRAHRR